MKTELRSKLIRWGHSWREEYNYSNSDSACCEESPQAWSLCTARDLHTPQCLISSILLDKNLSALTASCLLQTGSNENKAAPAHPSLTAWGGLLLRSRTKSRPENQLHLRYVTVVRPCWGEETVLVPKPVVKTSELCPAYIIRCTCRGGE